MLQWKPSITSANILGDCSVGVLATGSTMQWDPSPYNQEQSEIAVNWISQTTTTEFEHQIVVRTTAGPPRYDRFVVMRLLCHYLLMKLPEEGLPEVCRSMADAYDYYLRTPRLVSSQQLKRPSTKAKTSHRYERPSFPIVEE